MTALLPTTLHLGRPAPTLAAHGWAVERALHRYGAVARVHPVLLRKGLVHALMRPLVASFGTSVYGGYVRLGAAPERHEAARLAGIRLLLPPAPVVLHPHAVSLVQRDRRGAVRVVSGVPFGRPSDLDAAAAESGVPGLVLRGAIAATVVELASLRVPAGARVIARPTPYGWVPLRMVDVVDVVGSPVREIGLDDARLLVGEARPGESVGVSLPDEDWLTPLLRWTRGAG